MEMKYRDEEDKCYGAAGMAIGVAVYKAEGSLAGANIDNPAWRLVDFYDEENASSPAFSAKAVWGHTLENFEVELAMAIGNVLCRALVRDRSYLDFRLRNLLLDAAKKDGFEYCSLEADEVSRLFEKEYSYLERIFSHDGIAHIASGIASRLQDVRSLSRMELLEALQPLRAL